MSKQIILASSSPYRKKLLEKLIPNFKTYSPDIDEQPLKNEQPIELVQRLAKGKAEKTIKDINIPNSIYIASDQVAVFNNQILGKPYTNEKAYEQLTSFSGNAITFLTSLYVTDTITHYNTVDKTTVYFKKISDHQITNYIQREKPLNCAGSFKSEGLGIALFDKIEASDPNALIGLPLIELVKLLENLDYFVI